MELLLYHFPGACSRVTLTALEQCGVHYEDQIVDLAAGEQKSEQFRRTNPRGKVPALVVDGALLTENGAILTWLDLAFAEAGLLPRADDAWGRAQIMADIFWISASWHPATRANRMPVRWTTGDVEPVRERGRELLTPCIEQLEQRLSRSEWWYDERSILDAYFYWNYTTAQEGGFDLSPYPNIARHRAMVGEWDAFRRALAREKAAIERSAACSPLPK